jgi:hypothetical protein
MDAFWRNSRGEQRDPFSAPLDCQSFRFPPPRRSFSIPARSRFPIVPLIPGTEFHG